MLLPKNNLKAPQLKGDKRLPSGRKLSAAIFNSGFAQFSPLEEAKSWSDGRQARMGLEIERPGLKVTKGLKRRDPLARKCEFRCQDDSIFDGRGVRIRVWSVTAIGQINENEKDIDLAN